VHSLQHALFVFFTVEAERFDIEPESNVMEGMNTGISEIEAERRAPRVKMRTMKASP